MDPHRPTMRKLDPGPDVTFTDPDCPGAGPEDTLAGAPHGMGPAAESRSPETTVASPEIGQTVGGPTPSASQRRPPPTVDGYEILGELGRGGMGVVYRARRVLLNRPCALKMILSGVHAAPEAAVRFLAEAEAVAKLRHPNVVQIHHIGEAGGLPYFELEYCAGGSLDRALDGTPRPARSAAELVEGLARGVAEAHRQGLVHRDLKPANVLLGDNGTPKVTDFGLVKTLGIDRGLTRTDSLLGSPSYMAPEQAGGRAHEAGPEADVYSLGAILYELLAGRPPFRGATMLDTLEQARSADPVPPSRLVPGTPRDLETICLKCLEKPPERRYSDAAGLADDLRRFLDGDSILARPAPPWERTAKWARRRPALASTIAAIHMLLGALLLTGVWSYAQIRGALDAAESARRRAVESAAHEATARAAAEEAGALEASARAEAEASRNAALAETSRALLSETRALRLSHEAGWRGEAMKNLARLATIEAPSRDLVRLRTEAVACLGEPDVRPLAILGAGDRGVWEVAFHPGGKALATNDDKASTVHLWDAEAARPIRDIPKASGFAPFAFHPDGSCLAFGAPGDRVVFEPMAAGAKVPPPLSGSHPVLALAFDRAGGRLAVAWGWTGNAQGAPGTIERIVVHDVASGLAVRTIPGPFDTLNYKAPMALSPDGTAIATMGANHQVQIWKVDGTDGPAVLGRHLTIVEAMAFAPDGASLATCGRAPDPVVKVWDVAAGRERLSLYGHSSTIWSVAFSPDGATLASAGGEWTIRFWDPRDGRLRLVASTAASTGNLSMAFAPDGRRFAVGGQRAQIFELEGFDTKKTLAGHDNVVFDLSFRPGGAELASVSYDGRCIIWDLKGGSRRGLVPADGVWPSRVAYAPDGAWLVIGPAGGSPSADPNSSPAYLRVVDAATGKRRSRLTGPVAQASALAVDASGRRIASGSADGAAFAWDVATGALLRRVKLGRPVQSVALLPGGGGSTLFAAAEGGHLMWVDPAGGVPREAMIPGGPMVFAVSPGGDRLAAGSPDGSIRVVRLPDLLPLATASAAHARPIRRLAFHPGGRFLASAGDDSRLVLRDAGSLRPLLEIPAQTVQIEALAFSPECASLAFAGRPEEIIVWDFDQIRSRLDALGLGWESSASRGTQAAGPPSPSASPAWVEVVEVDTRSGRALLNAEAGPSLPASGYRRALDDLRREAAAFPGSGELLPQEATLHRVIASVYLLAGDRPGYDRHCAAILGRLTPEGPPGPAGDVAWSCVVAPSGGVEPDRLIRLSKLAILKHNASVPWWRNTLALALLRAGRHEEALSSLNNADRLDPEWPARPLNDLVRAIVRLRQGRPDEARPLLDSALLRAGRPRGGPPGPGRILARAPLHDALTFEVLRREAETLLLDTAFPATPFAR